MLSINSLTTDLCTFVDESHGQNCEKYIEKLKTFIKSDKDFEKQYKLSVGQLRKKIEAFVENDHGLVEYLLELYAQVSVTFKARHHFLSSIVKYISSSQPQKKLQNMVYSKLQDETKRLSAYKQSTADIFQIIRKREEVSQYDVKYKASLDKQLFSKIEEFDKYVKTLKKKQGENAVIDQVYYKGFVYLEMCRAER